MRQTLYLTRHGETDWNREGRWQGHTNISLNQTGRDQAQALARRLSGLGIAHIAASDLARARETAEIVAQHLGIRRVHIDQRLRERSFGVFEGLTREEVATRFPNEWADYSEDRKVTPPGAEPHELVIARVKDAVLSVTEALENAGPGLVVTHGGALRVLITAVTGQELPPVPNAAVYRVDVEHGVFGLAQLLD